MIRLLLFFILSYQIYSLHINCYTIVSIIQEKNIYLYPETEKRLHLLCPTVSAHIVSGDETIYDGAVETLLNWVDGSPRDNCILKEEKYLRKIGLNCSAVD